MLRVIILDDEKSAITVLRHKLLKNFPEEVELVATFDDPEDALSELAALRPDVLFLDVEMPGMSGLELLEQLPERTFAVVFTTAYQQYAIEAIRKSAFDYLVKPIDESDLRQSVERLLQKKKIAAPAISAAALPDFQVLAQALREAQQTVAKLSVPTTEGLLLIPIADIVRLEGSGSYAVIHTTTKQKIVASKNLSEFEELLAAQPHFFRTHKSHLINLNHVTRYLRGEGGSVIMSDGSEVEVARRRKEEFLAKLNGGG
jgi:two-component system LytT family response regulator